MPVDPAPSSAFNRARQASTGSKVNSTLMPVSFSKAGATSSIRVRFHAALVLADEDKLFRLALGPSRLGRGGKHAARRALQHMPSLQTSHGVPSFFLLRSRPDAPQRIYHTTPYFLQQPCQCDRQFRVRRGASSLDRAGRQSGDEMALAQERKDDHRQDHQHPRRGEPAPVHAGIAGVERRHHHRQRLRRVVGQHCRKQEIVPRQLQAQDAARHQSRPRKRQNDMQECR